MSGEPDGQRHRRSGMRRERRAVAVLVGVTLLLAACGTGGGVETSATSPPVSSTGAPDPTDPSPPPPDPEPSDPAPSDPVSPDPISPDPVPSDEVPPPPAPSADATLLPLAEPVAVGSATATFVELLEDSRCPPDVACVWQGDLRVLVTWEAGGVTEQVSLTWAYHADPTPVGGGAARLALDDVAVRDGVLTAEVRVLPA